MRKTGQEQECPAEVLFFEGKFHRMYNLQCIIYNNNKPHGADVPNGVKEKGGVPIGTPPLWVEWWDYKFSTVFKLKFPARAVVKLQCSFNEFVTVVV